MKTPNSQLHVILNACEGSVLDGKNRFFAIAQNDGAWKLGAER